MASWQDKKIPYVKKWHLYIIRGVLRGIPIDKAMLKYAHFPPCYVYQTIIISTECIL